MQFNRVAAPLFLLGFALDSAALTLGQVQGAALIGRPLNLSIPVSLGEGEAGDGFCATAEILQGSSRIDPGRVTVSVESDSRSGGARLRVRSSAAIDEPVVTINLQAGCAMKSSRQYVLLSDMPAEPASPAITASAARTPTFPAVASSDADQVRRRANAEAVLANARRSASSPSSPATANAPAPARDVPREAVSRPRSAPSRASVAAGATSTVPTAAPRTPPRTVASVAPAATTGAAPTASRPRLQLDAAVPATAAAPALAASAAPAVAPVVATAPSATPATAASAAVAAPSTAGVPAAAASAATPAASEAAAGGAPAVASPAAAIVPPTPEEAERALRLQVMEATLNALRAQTAENQRTLTDVRAELVASRESRYLNPIVYALIGLLLLALLAIVFLLRASRRRAASAWWNDSIASDDDSQAAGNDGVQAAASSGSRPAPLVPGGALAAQGVRNDAEFDEDAAQTRPQAATAPAGKRAHDDDTDLAPARNVNTEELFDVQQQSDFFLSLGQHAQAIAVLSEHIAENPQTSALAYLDLLRIHHSLGNRDAYGRVGQEFERAFNATLPSFDSFNDGGNGLEHYRSTLARITEQWPAPETLAVIEELVFRRPGTDGNEAFDLAAYQELLLLYAVAKEVIDPDSRRPSRRTPYRRVPRPSCPTKCPSRRPWRRCRRLSSPPWPPRWRPRPHRSWRRLRSTAPSTTTRTVTRARKRARAISKARRPACRCSPTPRCCRKPRRPPAPRGTPSPT